MGKKFTEFICPYCQAKLVDPYREFLKAGAMVRLSSELSCPNCGGKIDRHQIMMGVYDIKGPQKTGITGKIKKFFGGNAEEKTKRLQKAADEERYRDLERYNDSDIEEIRRLNKKKAAN